MIAAPATDGINVVNRRNAFNPDIISVLESNYPRSVANTKEFAQRFQGANAEQTAHNVWNFLRSKIRYKRDPEHRQLIRIPGRFIKDAEGDCKSYALSACSILSNLGFKTSFRYTSYSNSTTPTHVYCVAEKDGRKFIVDGVYHTFNAEKPFTYKTDHTMNIETLSGIEIAGHNRHSRLFNKNFDINNRSHLEKAYSHMRNKNSLAAKIFQKRISGDQSSVSYNRLQLQAYKARLIQNIAIRPNPFVKAVLLDELRKVETNSVRGGIFGTGEDHEIGKIGKGRLKKAFQKLKKVGLAPNRAAFLLLVKLNIKNLARKLQAANQTKLKKAWEKLGGDFGKLQSAANAGSKKKAIGGQEGAEIGFVVAAGTAAALASAATIIAALASLLKKKAPGETTLPGEESTTSSLLNTFDTLKSAAIDAGVLPSKLTEADKTAEEITEGKAEVSDKETGFSFGSPLVLGAVAVGAFLLLKKK
jgi:hypothetical protein